ncbi:hypothetical protein [Paucibacter sp. XJ19-41]|uniref:hypothetical protein n=1 Tax=Paucibacter sp. XJ19-41 TaxID=2927824 RepID=UPI00234AA344|nr:hypothetical protein [Paucibacter sp. XJ19-41]MDC6168394.1 hypothetical protein [Paucibacter sp. XJ19-41]
MTITEAEAQSRAVASFQALLSKHRPGSSTYRIAERALDLAFNGACAYGAHAEQALMVEAENLITKQVQAKLLALPAEPPQPIASPSPLGPASTRFLAWRGTLRSHAAEQFVQAELWLTTEGHRGDGYALLS